MQKFAKKSLGQNFLANPSIVERIVNAAEIGKNDTVLEVGPGTGNLTRALALRASRVIAIEKDHRLVEELRTTMPSNVEIVGGDALYFDPTGHSLSANGYKIVANIPYYITSHFIRAVFESWPQPQLIVLMVQKEVAQRIMARPPSANLLSLSVQFYSVPKLLFRVSRGNFRPIPSVDSAIVSFMPHKPPLPIEHTEKFFRLIRTAFSGKRKQLANSLSSIAGNKEDAIRALETAHIAPSARPEKLSMEDWLRLFSTLSTD